MSPLRLGIIGFGVQGSVYAKLIQQGRVRGMALTAIAESDGQRAGAARAEFRDVPIFGDHLALLDSGECEAVIICTPHLQHPSMGIDALTRGVHILVDKPAGVHVKQVAELLAVARSKPDTTFAMMFNQRANPLYRQLKQVVAGGEIGEVLRSAWIITTWWRPHAYYAQSPWRATWGGEGGGVLVNQAPHQLDLWQWICGVPRSVYAKAGYGFRRPIAVEDEVSVLADYGDGKTGTFISATHEPVGTDRFEILGSQGKIIVEDSRRALIVRLKQPEIELSAQMDTSAVRRLMSGQSDVSGLYTTEEVEHDSPWGDQHAAILENFADSILRGAALIAPGADAIKAVRLANAIHLSSWTGRETALDFDPDDFLAQLNARIRAEGKFAELT